MSCPLGLIGDTRRGWAAVQGCGGHWCVITGCLVANKPGRWRKALRQLRRALGAQTSCCGEAEPFFPITACKAAPALPIVFGGLGCRVPWFTWVLNPTGGK